MSGGVLTKKTDMLDFTTELENRRSEDKRNAFTGEALGYCLMAAFIIGFLNI